MSMTLEEFEAHILDEMRSFPAFPEYGPALVRLIDDVRAMARVATFPRLSLSFRFDLDDGKKVPLLTCPTCGAELDGNRTLDVSQLWFVEADGDHIECWEFRIQPEPEAGALVYYFKGTHEPESAGYLIHEPAEGKPHAVSVPENVRIELV